MNSNYQSNPMAPRPYMGIVEAVKVCLNKYADFSGRASRAEYWWWYLATLLVSLIFGWNQYLSGAAGLALLLPTLAVSWRRMHDIGKGGGWFFINLIPLVGLILWIVWCCKRSEQFPNRFGEVPEA